MEATALPNSTGTGRPRRETNWAFVARVGLVVAIVGSLVGYAAYSAYQVLHNKGISGDQVDLLTISSFEMDPVRGTIADVPADYRALDGRKVWTAGEIAPSTFTMSGGVGRFDLCFSVQKCCFGGPPKAQHFVKCRMVGGAKQVMPDSARVKVYGTLNVKVVREGGQVQSVYQMDVERLEPAA